MKMKKLLAVLAAMSMVATAFAGCGSKEDTTAEAPAATTEAATEAATEAPTEAATEEVVADDTDAEAAEYADAIANTVWVGMSADDDYDCFVMAFSDEEVYIATTSDDSTIEGYWGVQAGDPTFYVFSDPELTDEIYEIPWQYDEESDTIILNDTVVMAQTDAESVEDALNNMQELADEMEVAAEVAEALDGTYWVGGDDTEYDAIGLSGDDIMVYAVMSDGTEQTLEGKWGMDYDNLYIYDTDYTELGSFVWNVDEDGNLYLDDTMYEMVSEDDANNIVDYLHSLVAE